MSRAHARQRGCAPLLKAGAGSLPPPPPFSELREAAPHNADCTLSSFPWRLHQAFVNVAGLDLRAQNLYPLPSIYFTYLSFPFTEHTHTHTLVHANTHKEALLTTKATSRQHGPPPIAPNGDNRGRELITWRARGSLIESFFNPPPPHPTPLYFSEPHGLILLGLFRL